MKSKRPSRLSALLATVAMLAAVLPLLASPASAAPKTTIVVSAGHTDVGNYNLEFGAPIRTELLDNTNWANLGVTGLTIKDATDTVTSAYLADVDIFFDGWVFDEGAGAIAWTSDELDALEEWVRNGGVLITNEDDGTADALINQLTGVTSAIGPEATGGPCLDPGCSNYAVAAGAGADSLVNGPFGAWTSLDTHGTVGHFPSLDGSWTVVANHTTSAGTFPALAYRSLDDGFIVLSGDEGIWRFESPDTAMDPDNLAAAMNIFAEAIANTDDGWIRIEGPEPLTWPQGYPIDDFTFDTNGGTPGAITWSATGLPTGVTLSTGGVMSGTPTTVGPNTVVVSADGAANGAGVDATFTFRFNIEADAVPAPVDDLFAGAIGGSGAFLDFNVCDNDDQGNGPLTVTLEAGATLPSGLFQRSDTCEFNGFVTATASGEIDYTVVDVDGDAGTRTATITLNITTDGAPIVNGDSIVGTIGSPIAGLDVCANDVLGIGSNTFALVDSLPAGLVNTSGSPFGCFISGTPTSAFTGSVTYSLTDGNAQTTEGEIAFNITSGGSAPVTANDDTATGTVGEQLAVNVCTNDAYEGTPSVSSSNAPSWLTFGGSTGCVATGTPTADGTYTADYTLTAGGESDTARLTITVGEATGPVDNRTLECAPAGGFSLAGSTPGKQTNGDSFGESLASGDFNGDGLADVAIGAPDDNDGKGSVTVFLSPCGSSNARRYTQSGAVPGNNKGKDHFGHSLAAGDFDGDGRDDLAIGVPWEDVNGVKNSGAVTVLYGSSSGISKSDNQYFTQVGPTPGANERLDRFGFSLGAGDFDGDGRDDLLVGVPYERIGSKKTKAGAVVMLLGSNNGLTNTGSKLFTQKGKVSEKPAKGDRFGFAIATGDFNNDGNDDAAIGAPYEDHSGTNNVGAVHILDGSSSGLGTSGQQLFRGNSTGQRLGWRLAAGNLTGDAFDDLLAGERATGSRGGVNMFAGSASGISFADSTSQADSSSASPNTGDRYSMGLAVVDIDGDGVGEAAVGAPREDSAGANAGAVHVYEITGGRFGAETYYTQANSAVPGSPATGANFGQVLAAGSDGSLFVGAPGGTAGSTANAGMVAPI